MTPLLTIVVPTCNRRDSLLRLLDSIAADRPAPAFEVIVVDDGSADSTVAMLSALRPPYSLRVVTQPPRGPALARNIGAADARGDILLFVDDDVELLPGTLISHAMFHANRDDRVGIGDLQPVVLDGSQLGITLRGWWERMLIEMRKPGHRFGFRNVLTGHLSIRRHRFRHLGGFDPSFRCHEDWEFGYRAMQANMRIGFVAGAAARHHETSGLTKILRRKFDEGIADVQLSARHPEIARTLPFACPIASRKARMLARLAWSPRLENPITALLEAGMRSAATVRMRGRWRALLDLRLTYWYWRGVAHVVSNHRSVSALARDVGRPAGAEASIDLAEGLQAAEEQLDRFHPASVRVFFHGVPVADIPPQPGLEPLRGEHLRPLLATPYYRWALGVAAAKAGILPMCVTNERSTHPGAPVSDTDTPFVRDEQLSPDLASVLDAQHRSAVPPTDRVA